MKRYDLWVLVSLSCVLSAACSKHTSHANAETMPAAEGGTGLNDGQVLAIYSQTNTFDIETGQLGDAQGASGDVRALGHMVATDHTAVRELATKLGAKLGLEASLPAGREEAAADHARVMAELRALAGPDFDRAYLREEIKFHTDAIQAVKTVLIPTTKSAELKKLMTDILPGFQHHLDETVRISKKLGYE